VVTYHGSYCKVEKPKIINGNYNITNKKEILSIWDIGKVYTRIVINISKDKSKYIDNLYEVLTSRFMEKLDNYDNGIYIDII